MMRQNFFRHLSNIPGWSTNRKIIVFESDDWGSIRMPSLGAYKRLEKAGLNLKGYDAERYNLNDSLATSKDLEDLFHVLSSYKDKHGINPVFTAMSIVANPDFEKIRNADFNEYFYETFTETLKKYPGCESSFILWEEGIEKKLFIPQLHGREHLNISSWIMALRASDKQTLMAFNEGLWGFVPDQELLPGVDFLAAFLLGKPNELEYHEKILIDGLDLFEKLFGYRAEYFVPPNGPFNNSLNTILVENGIRFRSTAKIQYESIDLNKTRKVINWLGKKDKSGIRYITRNCFFEPSQTGKDWVDSCLHDIKIAFRWKKPAIISSHRVNYIGVHNPKNRDNSLYLLGTLLTTIRKNWPDIEYMSTDKFGELMNP